MESGATHNCFAWQGVNLHGQLLSFQPRVTVTSYFVYICYQGHIIDRSLVYKSYPADL